MENVKEFSNEKLIEIYKECNYSLQKIEKTYGLGKNAASRLFKSRKIDYNKIKEENYKSPEDLYYENPKYCKHCGELIPYEKRENDFCNHSCSASFNNQGIPRNGEHHDNQFCLNCGKIINYPNKYCSSSCYHEYQYKNYIEKWRNNETDGKIGDYGTSNYIRKFLFNEYNCSCQLCGWNKVNKFTGRVPLQIHHIDGDCLNNRPENLQLLCPNCHSLTENYGNSNETSSRVYRKQKSNLDEQYILN